MFDKPTEFVVEQQTFEISDRYALMMTSGLGPCIGVAISFEGCGFVMHVPDARVLSEDITDPFFRGVANAIPIHSRRNIRPVVAGGCIDPVDEEEDVGEAESIEAARTYVLNCIQSLDFATPQTHWCPSGCMQNLSLHVANDSVEIVTESIVLDDFLDKKTLFLMGCNDGSY